MATRFYLPASGTAPLGSLAVDSQWELSDSLDRRPCDVVKSDTSLTQKSATWSSTTTQQWVWVQFQSKRLAAGYSWTTSDTVSMVVKVAEAVAQVDSHLCYVIRVVSGDGSTIRGTIGAYLTTSSEYPTSLASIATRIHDGRTDGASNFSSSAGDRIIIEIGHHGVSPALNVAYHNYGDPSATSDYALTAGLTTDLCPWVELSRTVSFDLTDSRNAYLKGKADATPNIKSAYLQGGNAPQNVSDSRHAYQYGNVFVSVAKPAYLKGSINTSIAKSAFMFGVISVLESKPAFLKAQVAVSQAKSAYLKGGINVSEVKHAFLRGGTSATPSVKSSYLKGRADISVAKSAYLTANAIEASSKHAYLFGVGVISSSKSAYLLGVGVISEAKPAYLNGATAGTDVSDTRHAYAEGGGAAVSSTKSAFLLGLGTSLLVPNGYIGSVGTWRNELDSDSNLYQSIDEPSYNDSDYIWDTDPATNDYIEFALSNPSGTPDAGDVVVFWRGRDKSGLNTQSTVQLRQGASTVIASQNVTLTASTKTYYFQLTPGERANITDWTDLRIRILPTTP